ncbi:MAG TPA: epimerase, partial [Acidobacteriota bacterium]|nr:epimerase [Acidobacteriota bacterium]
MKIVIPGGSGQVGTILARAFQEARHEVVLLSRTRQPSPWRVITWDAESLGLWASEL